MIGYSDILIRCDGGAVIGMGHVVRCGALATALAQRGAVVTFAMQDGADAVRAAGHTVIDLPDTFVRRDIPLPDSDADALIQAADANAAGVVVVDHYQATAEYLHRLKKAGLRVAVIDDLADRDLSAADWILNQNPFADELAYRVADGVVILRGATYALLRPQFATAREALVRDFTSHDGRILITLGGSAVFDKCAVLVAALAAIERALHIRVILGRSDAAEVVDAVRQSPHDVTMLHDVQDMAAEIGWADVALNAGGSTCWEMCCLGTPMVLTGLSHDQARNLPALASAGVAVETGPWDEQTPARMAEAAKRLLADPTRRRAMSRRAIALVDGQGAHRAADSLLSICMAEQGSRRSAEVGR